MCSNQADYSPIELIIVRSVLMIIFASHAWGCLIVCLDSVCWTNEHSTVLDESCI